MDSVNSGPHLPPEIEERIFIDAVRDDFDHVANYVLVSKRVHDWVLAVIFEVVILHPERTYPKKITLDQVKRYGHRVRHLLIYCTTIPDTDSESSISVNKCLTLFPNVENLALWIGGYNDETFQNLSQLPLHRLSLDFTELSETFLTPQLITLFSGVTHLDIVKIMLTWSECEVLVHFHALTHLAIYFHTAYEVLDTILQRVLMLKVVLWLSESFSIITETDLPEEIQDVRVVAIACPAVRDWENGARGEEDMWTFAERIVRERQSR